MDVVAVAGLGPLLSGECERVGELADAFQAAEAVVAVGGVHIIVAGILEGADLPGDVVGGALFGRRRVVRGARPEHRLDPPRAVVLVVGARLLDPGPAALGGEAAVPGLQVRAGVEDGLGPLGEVPAVLAAADGEHAAVAVVAVGGGGASGGGDALDPAEALLVGWWW